jgi:hypothetical protein
MDIYNATHRNINSHTFLAPDIEESIQLWMQKLNKSGWTTLYEPTPGEEAC